MTARTGAALLPDLAAVAGLLTFLYVLFLYEGYTRLFRDADAGWHLRSGEAMLSSGAFPRQDPYSFSKAGEPWMNWEWLADLSTVQIIVEDEASLVARLEARDVVYDRLRALGPLSIPLRRVLNMAGINVVDVPVLANGRLELRYYLREQALSQTIHRYGNILRTSRET